MAKVRINEKSVKAIPAPAKGYSLTFDDKVPGFGVRVTANGARSFILRYRAGLERKDRIYTIGKFPDWTATAARDKAEELRRLIVRDIDPADHRAADRAAPTMDTLCDEYLTKHARGKKRAKSVEEDERNIEKIIRPKWGKRRVDAITFKEVTDLHAQRGEEAPVSANRLGRLLSKMFNLAVAWGYREDNPAKGLEYFEEQPRQRYLTPDEMTRLATALDDAAKRSPRSVNAIRLILWTGARKNEVLKAMWDKINLENGVWTKPSAHTKQKKEHSVPLSKLAVDMLKAMKEDAPPGVPWVFPGDALDEDGNVKHLTTVKTIWGTIREAAGVPDVRIHDLRHSYASALANSGFQLEVIGKLLGHTQTSTAGRYAHLYEETTRGAVDAVADMMAGKGKAK